MYGAIIGDIVGSPYEFDLGKKTKDFKFYNRFCRFTDDTVLTIAVADALISSIQKQCNEEETRQELINCMRKWTALYPGAGYGSGFIKWIYSDNPNPYFSFGNGSAMRVSSVGWLYETLKETRKVARLTAEITHNHPEGIKGAEATASAIFLARTGKDKNYIKNYIEKEFGYNLSFTLNEIRPTHMHNESCQKSVPEAIVCFLEGTSFEDVIRNVISIGGDTDTLGAIAGSIAEAYYGITLYIKIRAKIYLKRNIIAVLKKFKKYKQEISK